MKILNPVLCALLVSIAACSNTSESQIVSETETWFKETIESAKAEFQTIYSDESKSEEERMSAIGVLQDKLASDVKDKAAEVIDSYPSSQAAVIALKSACNFYEPEELESALAKLEGDAAKDEFVEGLQRVVSSRKSTAAGNKFVDFTIVQDEADPDGSTVRFSDFVGCGKYVLVDFWASWCGPCKREIPNIANVYDKYKGDDFDVLSVAVWDKPEDTKAAAQAHGVIWNQIINAQSIPTDLYGIDGIPHIMLVGPDGTILNRDLRGDDIEAAVSEALGR